MKNIRKRRILAWILAAVLMITQCPSNVFADVVPTESNTEQQVAPAEETESSESVNEEAPAESSGENGAEETQSSQPEDAGSETVQENQEGSEQAKAPKEEQTASKEKQTASKEEPAKGKDATDSGKASAAKAPAAKTDSSAEKKDEAEEEENSEADLVGAPGDSAPVPLESMTSSLTCSADPSEGVGRGDSISLQMAFNLRDDAISTARDAEYWTYDLSSVVGPDQTILSLTDGAQGTLYQDSENRGHYEIHGTKVQLYVDKAWLSTEGLSDVSGTFRLSAKLNETENASKDEATIMLPGTSGVTIKFEERTLNSSKKVGASNGDLRERTGGEKVDLVENSDGTYTLYYSVSVKPNVNQSKISVRDTVSEGQTLNWDSLKLNGQPADFWPAQYGNGFMLDIEPAKKNTDYVITYTTTITREQLGKHQENTAIWTWDGTDETDTTDVVPSDDYNLNAYKNAGPTKNEVSEKKDGVEVTLTEKNPDGTYNIWYLITFSPNKASSTFTISDSMTGGQKLVGEPEISANNQAVTPQSIVTSDSGFSINLGSVSPNTYYQIWYKTTVTEDQIDEAIRQKNSAKFSWKGDDVEVTTDLTPKRKIVEPDKVSITKSAISGVTGNSVKPGATVEFKLVLGKDNGNFNYAGIKVDDIVGENQKQYFEYVDDSFSINPTVTGGSFVKDPGPGRKIFSYTFPTDQDYFGKYEITYKVKIAENAPVGTWLHNTGKIGEGPGATESTTGIQVKKGDPAELAKEATEWNLESNTIYWTITITVPEETTVTDTITDTDAEIATDKNFQKISPPLLLRGLRRK